MHFVMYRCRPEYLDGPGRLRFRAPGDVIEAVPGDDADEDSLPSSDGDSDSDSDGSSSSDSDSDTDSDSDSDASGSASAHQDGSSVVTDPASASSPRRPRRKLQRRHSPASSHSGRHNAAAHALHSGRKPIAA